MANKYAIPPNHPLHLVGYGLLAAGVLLLLSLFFLGSNPDPGLTVHQLNAEMDAKMFYIGVRIVGGMGLILLGLVLRVFVAEWVWNNAQPEISVRVRVTSKWTATWGAPNTGSATYYYARFESGDSDTLDLNMGLDVYQQFGEGDNGTLTYQGSRVLAFRRA